MPDNSPESAESPEVPHPSAATSVEKPQKTSRSYSSLVFWTITGVCLLAVVLAKTRSDDPAPARIIGSIGFLVVVYSFVVWFRFFSGYQLSTRRALARAMLGITLLVAVGVSIFALAGDRKLRFSGGMMPELIERQRLEAEHGSGTADLSTATATDFPQFLGPDRNSVVNSIHLNRDWNANPPKLLWKRKLGAGWSGFSAVGNYAVTIEQRGDEEELEVVTCYEIGNGKPVWSSAIQARHYNVMGFLGPRSTPTIHQGKVYAMGGTGILRCLEGSDGSEIWRRDFMDERGISQKDTEKSVMWGRSSSPLVVDDMLIVNVGGTSENRTTLAALDLESGETIWESGDYQISYASPALMTLADRRQIVSVNEDYVSAHDVQTGEILWEHPWKGRSNMDANCSQPVAIDGSRVFLSKGYGKGAELIQVEPPEGAGQWGTKTLWTAKVMKTKFSNVAVRDGFAYGLDDGILSCVEVDTGDRRWKKGRFGYGQILMVDDLILVMAERKGTLSLVEANPDQFVELGKIDALEGQTWNTLCLVGKRLLLRNAEEAACYELR